MQNISQTEFAKLSGSDRKQGGKKKRKKERKSCNFSTEQERIRGREHTQTETFKQNDKMKEKLKENTKNLQTKQNNIKKKKL